ncbi:hypothetical protein EOD23_27155 [Mesorhizobium sp. USDA-HM6]|nr:hypothetical protein EOD23_27155 [Mesorhizobium sp. USDA-HM6]
MRGAPAWRRRRSGQHPSSVSALRADPLSPTRRPLHRSRYLAHMAHGRFLKGSWVALAGYFAPLLRPLGAPTADFGQTPPHADLLLG